MEEKLKYRVGEEVFIRANVIDIDNERFSYRVKFENYDAWLIRGLVLNHNDLKPLPKITQEVMDWYEEVKHERNDWIVSKWLTDSSMPRNVEDWIYGENHLENQHALATLIAYGPQAVEVEKEKEKRYRVVFKSSGQVLSRVNDHIADEVYFMFLHNKHGAGGMCYPKQALIDSGFEGVFDNPMFEVEEVV